MSSVIEVLGMPEGRFVAEKLAMPAESAELGLGVSINAVSGTGNKELEQRRIQELLGLHGQLAPVYMQLVQVAVQQPGTPVGQTALDLANGMSHLYRRLLEQGDFRAPEEIAPEIQAPPPPPPPQPGFGPGAQPGGGPGGPAPGADPRMAGVPAGAGGAVPSGNGGLPPGPPA